jgi:hypothetical protein
VNFSQILRARRNPYGIAATSPHRVALVATTLSPLTTRKRTIGVVVTLIVALQVAVPLTAFDENRPSRFGWHMFADKKKQPSVTVVAPGGTSTFPVKSVVARWRPEANYTLATVQYACDRYPTATSVVLSNGEAEVNGEYPC